MSVTSTTWRCRGGRSTVLALGRSASLNRFGSQTNPGGGRDAAATSWTAWASHGKKAPAPSHPDVESPGSALWAAWATTLPASGRSAERTRRRTALHAGLFEDGPAFAGVLGGVVRGDVRPCSMVGTGGSSSTVVSCCFTSSASSSAVMADTVITADELAELVK